ncbi:hypothetical protein GDO81_001015 [Engystomops pustulosus]|uniref:Uncharacterized protein n=1 Tax=Engystomops pustulosus TaxID=76066 RepID=A0AAV7DAF8_ENGPU|nr:hypothetical protein GDO81_001015 [Engystomops pustulosus]
MVGSGSNIFFKMQGLLVAAQSCKELKGRARTAHPNRPAILAPGPKSTCPPAYRRSLGGSLWTATSCAALLTWQTSAADGDNDVQGF